MTAATRAAMVSSRVVILVRRRRYWVDVVAGHSPYASKAIPAVRRDRDVECGLADADAAVCGVVRRACRRAGRDVARRRAEHVGVGAISDLDAGAIRRRGPHARGHAHDRYANWAQRRRDLGRIARVSGERQHLGIGANVGLDALAAVILDAEVTGPYANDRVGLVVREG